MSTGWALGHAVRTDPGASYYLFRPGIVSQDIVHQVGTNVYAWCIDPGYSLLCRKAWLYLSLYCRVQHIRVYGFRCGMDRIILGHQCWAGQSGDQ